MTFPPDDLAEAMKGVEDREAIRHRKADLLYVEHVERQLMMWTREAERMRQLCRAWEEKFNEEHLKVRAMSAELIELQGKVKS